MAIGFQGGMSLAQRLRQMRQAAQGGGAVFAGPLGEVRQMARGATGQAGSLADQFRAKPPGMALPGAQGGGVGFGSASMPGAAPRMAMSPAAPAPLPAPQGSGIGFDAGGTTTPNLPQPAPRTPPRLDPRRLGTRVANQAFRRQQEYFGLLRPEIARLQDQANQDRFSDMERANYLGPHLDQLGREQEAARGTLARLLAERGLGDSSAMASGMGALEMGGAQARTGVISDLFQREEDRQLQAQDTLRQLLAALANGQQGQAASLAVQLRQLELQQKELDARNQIDWGGLLSGIGGLAGAF